MCCFLPLVQQLQHFLVFHEILGHPESENFLNEKKIMGKREREREREQGKEVRKVPIYRSSSRSRCSRKPSATFRPLKIKAGVMTTSHACTCMLLYLLGDRDLQLVQWIQTPQPYP